MPFSSSSAPAETIEFSEKARGRGGGGSGMICTLFNLNQEEFLVADCFGFHRNWWHFPPLSSQLMACGPVSGEIAATINPHRTPENQKEAICHQKWGIFARKRAWGIFWLPPIPAEFFFCLVRRASCTLQARRNAFMSHLRRNVEDCNSNRRKNAARETFSTCCRVTWGLFGFSLPKS